MLHCKKIPVLYLRNENNEILEGLGKGEANELESTL